MSEETKIEVKRTCEWCKFWHETGNGLGKCRRYAPRPGGTDERTRWPSTAFEDWCADFKLNKAKAHEAMGVKQSVF